MKIRTYSKDIAEAISTALENDGWKFKFNEELGIFQLRVTLNGKLRELHYALYVQNDNYMVYAISPIGANEDDPDNMAAMAEFLCRVNYGLKCGNFEMDYEDGEIRYKYSIECRDGIPSTKVILHSIYCPATMFEQYGTGILSVLYGYISAERAVELCEMSAQEAEAPQDEAPQIRLDLFGTGS